MAKVDSYREGIQKTAEGLRARASTSSMIKEEKGTKTPTPVAKDENLPQSSPDYVVDVGSLKDRAQKLIDSGHFSGEDLTMLKGVVSDKDIE